MIREFELALENLVFGAPADQDLARSVIEQLEWAQTGDAGSGLAGLLLATILDSADLLSAADIERVVRAARAAPPGHFRVTPLIEAFELLDAPRRYLLMPVLIAHPDLDARRLVDLIVALDARGLRWTQVPDGPRGHVVFQALQRRDDVSAELKSQLLERYADHPAAAGPGSAEAIVTKVERLKVLRHELSAASSDIYELDYEASRLLAGHGAALEPAQMRWWQEQDSAPQSRAAALVAAVQAGSVVSERALVAAAQSARTRHAVMEVFGDDPRVSAWSGIGSRSEGVIAEHLLREDWTRPTLPWRRWPSRRKQSAGHFWRRGPCTLSGRTPTVRGLTSLLPGESSLTIGKKWWRRLSRNPHD